MNLTDHLGRPLREFSFSVGGYHVHDGEPLADRPATLAERAAVGDVIAQRTLAEQEHDTTKG